MTVDEFIAAVNSQLPMAFAKSVASLTESQRKSLSKAAQQLLRAARERERLPVDPALLIRSLNPLSTPFMNELNSRQQQTAKAWLAVLTVCPQSATVKAMNFDESHVEAAVQILIDRRPAWVGSWLEAQLQGSAQRFNFKHVQRLINSGACPKPTSLGFARLFSNSALLIDFESEPDLLENIWLLFQHDVNAFYSFPDAKSRNMEQWRASPRPQKGELFWGVHFRLIYHYAYRGVIDRERVLSESLAALWRDFKQPSRAGLVKLHELLEPNRDERCALQPQYRELLQHSAPPIAGFGLQMLKVLQKDGTLNTEAFIEMVPAILAHKPKGPPIAALLMLKTIANQQPNLIVPVLQVAVRGLCHAAADVQDAALTLLESKSTTNNLSVKSLLELTDYVTPKLKSRLQALVGKVSAEDDATRLAKVTSPSFAAQSENKLTDLRHRADLLPKDLRNWTAVDEAFEAFTRNEIPPHFDIDQIPAVLGELQPIEPISDIDSLIDRLAIAIENITAPIEIECIIDAICRFRVSYPENFAARTQAIVHRMANFQPHMGSGENLMGIRFIAPTVLALIEDWLKDRHIVEEPAQGWMTNVLSWGKSKREPSHFERFIDHRIQAIRVQLKSGVCGPLLSLPTHERGWIDARIFVERIRQCLLNNQQPNRTELTYGLLRLAPDGREQAIAQSNSLAEPYGQLVRFALGCQEAASLKDASFFPAWLAAGRTRSPRGQLPELLGIKLPNVANGIEAAQFHFDWTIDQTKMEQHVYDSIGRPKFVRVTPETKMLPEHPSIALTAQIGSEETFGSFIGCVDGWLTTIWPANPDSRLAASIDNVMMRLNASGSSWFNTGNAVRPLLASERSWSNVGLVTLWLGLLSKEPEVRATARDALADGMMDGRAHPEPLARVLLNFVNKDWCKLNRLAESLRDVARVSKWSTLVTSEILNSLIANWHTLPRDAHYVLELQLELLADLQAEIPEVVRAMLANITGSSKTAKLAKQLVNLKQSDGSEVRREALLEAVQARIARAERASGVSFQLAK